MKLINVLWVIFMLSISYIESYELNSNHFLTKHDERPLLQKKLLISAPCKQSMQITCSLIGCIVIPVFLGFYTMNLCKDILQFKLFYQMALGIGMSSFGVLITEAWYPHKGKRIAQMIGGLSIPSFGAVFLACRDNL